MNKQIAEMGATIVTITVALFAVFMITSIFGSYFVCIFLVLGYHRIIH